MVVNRISEWCFQLLFDPSLAVASEESWGIGGTLYPNPSPSSSPQMSRAQNPSLIPLNPGWFIGIPLLDYGLWNNPQYMKGSIIPELIINQQGFSSHCSNHFNPSEKYEFVNWDDYSQLNGKIKAMFQSPPTSYPQITVWSILSNINYNPYIIHIFMTHILTYIIHRLSIYYPYIIHITHATGNSGCISPCQLRPRVCSPNFIYPLVMTSD